MSATELDLPVLASADQIRRREFVTTRRGYDPDQVREFLERVADQIQQMEGLIRDARMEADAAIRARSEPRVDPYQQLAARLADVIRTADEAADRIRLEAREDAERQLNDARADADRVRTDAQSTAEEARASADRALAEASEQADRTIAGLSTRREALVGQLATMQDRLLGVAREIGSALDLETVTLTLTESESESESESETRTEVQASGPTDALFSGGPSSVKRSETDDATPALPVDPYQELWAGTEAIELEVPDMPPLDLSWGDDEED